MASATFHPKKQITFLKRITFSAVLALATLASCQTPDKENSTATTDQPDDAIVYDTAGQSKRRPAPEFYAIPADMQKNRVWVCDDHISDLFHTKNDCPELTTCKGTYRNVTLVRAIEDYERYNCETCSSELSDIFDEDRVRIETGLGDKR